MTEARLDHLQLYNPSTRVNTNSLTHTREKTRVNLRTENGSYIF